MPGRRLTWTSRDAFSSPVSPSSSGGRSAGLSRRTAGRTATTLEGRSQAVNDGDSAPVGTATEALPPQPAIVSAPAAAKRTKTDPPRHIGSMRESPPINMMDPAAVVHPPSRRDHRRYGGECAGACGGCAFHQMTILYRVDQAG